MFSSSGKLTTPFGLSSAVILIVADDNNFLCLQIPYATILPYDAETFVYKQKYMHGISLFTNKYCERGCVLCSFEIIWKIDCK